MKPAVLIKWMVFLCIVLAIVRCSSFKPMHEDSLRITRKYVGNFVDYRLAGEGGPLNPKIFWIKTSLDHKYGKIGVYAKGKMGFQQNERLYLRRIYFQHMALSKWTYQLESSNEQVFYNIYGTNMDSTRRSSLDRLFDIQKKNQ
ncbi:MAG: hypothetical protein QNK33_02795 [Bacteroidales bacterium]|nr:hypothetical protein [Bacteroidales bacterium]